MGRVVMFCKKCDYEAPSFERMDDLRFNKALSRIVNHMRLKHPRVRKFHRNYSWRYLEETQA